MGEALRKRYGDFLGKIYVPSNLEARSTDMDRTKMSLLLVLAALFPPHTDQTWNSELNWQPIPFSYKRLEDDPVRL